MNLKGALSISIFTLFLASSILTTNVAARDLDTGWGKARSGIEVFDRSGDQRYHVHYIDGRRDGHCVYAKTLVNGLTLTHNRNCSETSWKPILPLPILNGSPYKRLCLTGRWICSNWHIN